MHDPNMVDMADKARIRRKNPTTHGMSVYLEPEVVELLMKHYGDSGSDSDAIHDMLKQIDELKVDDKHEIVILDKSILDDIKKACPPWIEIDEFMSDAICLWNQMKVFYSSQMQFENYFKNLEKHQ